MQKYLILLIFSCALPLWADNTISSKILYIASYHEGHAWTDGTTSGVVEILNQADVDLKIHYMDTKRNRSEAFKKQAATQAKNLIESYQPDIVLISDDNAVKYLLKPYFKDSELPFVFSGVNWDASIYGLPYQNTTGIIEVELIKPLLEQLRPFAKGKRIGYLAMNSLTSHKNVMWHQKAADIQYHKVYYVDTFDAWKHKYLQLQQEVDMMIIGSPQGIDGWNKLNAIQFVREHATIPTGATAPGREQYVLLGYLRQPQEHGRWAAKAALKILQGTKPFSIATEKNQEGKLTINQSLSEKLAITFPPAIFKRANIIWPYSKSKILYIASYHEGFAWSDGILRGINGVLEKTKVNFKVFHMDTKRNRTKADIKNAVEQAKQHINHFKPDVVITSDDNAAKYLVAAHYKNSELPFVFCGVNWDASMYGFPTKNVTGMEEVELIDGLVTQLSKYAKGNRIGLLSTNTLSGKKNAQYHERLYGITYDKVFHVENLNEWKQAFIELQQSVDMMVTETHSAISDWDQAEIARFVYDNIKIPVGSTSADRAEYSLFVYARIPEEQGRWSAKTALKIIDGVIPSEIAVTQNKQSKLYLNIRLVKQLGLTIDRSVYRRAEIIQ